MTHISATNIAEYLSLGQCPTILRKALSSKAAEISVESRDRREVKQLKRGLEAQNRMKAKLRGRPGWQYVASSSLNVFLEQVRARPDEVWWADEVLLTGTLAGVRIGAEGAESRLDFIVYQPVGESEKETIEVWECKSSFKDKLAHRFQLGVYAALVRAALAADGARIPVVGKVWREDIEAEPVEGCWSERSFSPEALDILISDLERMIAKAVEADGIPQIARICAYCREVQSCFSEVKKGDPVQLLMLERRDTDLLRKVRYDLRLPPEKMPDELTTGWGQVRLLSQLRTAYYLGKEGPEVVGEGEYIRLPITPADKPLKKVFFVVAESQPGKIGALGVLLRLPEKDETRIFTVGTEDGAEKLLLADAARWLDEQIGSPAGYQCHFYCWSYDELTLLVGRAYALSRAGTEEDMPLAGLAGLLSQDYALGQVKIGKEARPAREDWIATTLKEELSRRLHLASVGSSPIEVSLLRWKHINELDRPWLDGVVRALVAQAIGVPAIQDADELRRHLSARLWPDDFLPDDMKDLVMSDAGLGKAWFGAHLDTMARLEQGLNSAVDAEGLSGKRPLKLSYVGSPFASFQRAKDLAEACRDFLNLNESRRRIRMKAALQRTPRELVRRGQAAKMSAVFWDGKKFWGETEWPDGDKESFREHYNVSLKSGLLIPATDFNKQLDIKDIECGLPISGYWAEAGKPYEPSIAGHLRVRFKQAHKVPEGSLTEQLPGFAEDIPVDLHEGGTTMLWTRNFSLNLNRHLVERLHQPSTARHWLADKGTGLPDDPVLSEEEANLLQRLISRVGQYRPRHKELYHLLLEPNLSAALDQIAETLGKISSEKLSVSDESSLRLRQVLASRASLVQGPPGTGKTEFAAWAICGWIVLKVRRGEVPHILAVANTHRALDELSERLSFVFLLFRQALVDIGETSPELRILKVGRETLDQMAERNEALDEDDEDSSGRQKAKLLFSSKAENSAAPDIFRTKPLVCLDVRLNSAKLSPYPGQPADTLHRIMPTFIAMTAWSAAQYQPDLPADLMVVDEASMMQVAEFAGIIPSLADDTGQLLVMGDDRQLAPIVDTAWSATLRPEMREHRPHESVFSRMRKVLAGRPDAVVSLDRCFRCPCDVRDIIADVYHADNIRLVGRPRAANAGNRVGVDRLLFGDWEGIRLLSYRSDDLDLQEATHNAAEVAIVARLIDAAPLDEKTQKNLAIIAPYRKQVQALRKLPGLGKTTVDTVNRLQGAERETIVLSMTGNSDSLATQADFLLELNRLNVAVSRSSRRLILVCAEELLEFVPASAEMYDAMGILKRINQKMTVLHEELSVEGAFGRAQVSLRGPA